MSQQSFHRFRSWSALGALIVWSAVTVVSGASAAPRTVPTAAPAIAPLAACTNASKLTGWSTTRLAMLTIAVPVSETSPGQVTNEVAQGAGGVLLFGSKAPSNLGAQLAALRRHVPGRIGLLVMTDEEGGGIQRMANLVGSLPWARTMATHWTTAQIQAAVRAVAVRRWPRPG